MSSSCKRETEKGRREQLLLLVQELAVESRRVAIVEDRL